MDEHEDRIAELDMVAAWAGEMKLPRVQSYCGMAKAAIEAEIKRIRENRDAAKTKKGKA